MGVTGCSVISKRLMIWSSSDVSMLVSSRGSDATMPASEEPIELRGRRTFLFKCNIASFAQICVVPSPASILYQHTRHQKLINRRLSRTCDYIGVSQDVKKMF